MILARLPTIKGYEVSKEKLVRWTRPEEKRKLAYDAVP